MPFAVTSPAEVLMLMWHKCNKMLPMQDPYAPKTGSFGLIPTAAGDYLNAGQPALTQQVTALLHRDALAGSWDLLPGMQSQLTEL